MRSPVRFVLIIALAASSILAAASTARAVTTTNRYAEPGASGSACTKASPCSIVTAINKAPNGSTVHLAGGSYGPTSTVLTDNGHALTIAGAPSGGVPILTTSATTGLLIGGATSVSWLTIRTTGNTGLLLANEKASADHMNVSSQGSAADTSACTVEGTLIDSLCFTNATDGKAIGDEVTANFAETVHATLEGDTAIATGGGSSEALAYTAHAGVTFNVAVANTILIGGSHDVFARNPDNSGAVHIALTYCDYNSVIKTKTRATVTKLGTNHNITAAPKLQDAGLGEASEEANSPTVDAGIGIPGALKDLDLFGYPRYIGSAPDIGAYELPVAPTISDLKITKLSPTSITAKVTVNSHGMNFDVNLSATPIVGSAIVGPDVDPAITRTPEKATIKVTGLTTNTRYAVVASANGQGGQAKTSETDVVTPYPFKGASFASKIGMALKGKVAVDLTCPKLTTGLCSGTLSLTRPGHGTVGKGDFAIPAGATAGVKVKVDAATANAIKQHGHLNLTAKAKAKDGAKQKKTTHATVKATQVAAN